MASNELPCDYDAIILGSGMTECIVAAALSRIGYNVLHMDRNNYYSGDSACFNWNGIQEWSTTKTELTASEIDKSALLKTGESRTRMPINSKSISCVEQVTLVSDKSGTSLPSELNIETRNQSKSEESESKKVSENVDNQDESLVGSLSEENQVKNESLPSCSKTSTDQPVPPIGIPGNKNDKDLLDVEILNHKFGPNERIRVYDRRSTFKPIIAVCDKETGETRYARNPKYYKDIAEQNAAKAKAGLEDKPKEEKHKDEDEESGDKETGKDKFVRNEKDASEVAEKTVSKDSAVVEDKPEKEKHIDKDEELSNNEKVASEVAEETVSAVSAVVENKPEEERQKKYNLDDISSQWRKFNIDLMPKVLFCKGPMVELLISSDVAKYMEFRTISRVLTVKDGRLQPVPCSRSDVFSSKQVSMIEKRMMMKFLQFSLDYTNQPKEYEGSEQLPFCEYLKTRRLTENVCHYIQNAIAMVNDNATTLEGLAACQKFLQSLGRYGNTAFLWPLYGSGEMPQCFCRMCAVFGGCYCLRRTGTDVIVDAENKCTGIIDTEGQRLNCKWLIMESSYAPEDYKTNTSTSTSSNKIYRAVYITSQSMLHHPDEEHLTLLSYPRDKDQSPITVYEVGASSYACPKDMYLVHFTCHGNQSARQDFEELEKKLFKQEGDESGAADKPAVLWKLYFEVEDTNGVEYTDLPAGVFIVPGPDADMDFENSIIKAREIFDTLCPGEEFLPKAPNPEDIIWNEGDENKETQESGFEKGDSDVTEKQDPNAQQGEQEAAVNIKQDGAECEKQEGGDSKKQYGAECEKQDGGDSEEQDNREGEKQDGGESEKQDGGECEKQDGAECKKQDNSEGEKQDGVEDKKQVDSL